MTLPYQTLTREITTPTLPTYIASCFNLIAKKPSSKGQAPASLEDAIFRSFAILLPRHSTTFRPFASQIRSVIRPYVAPTCSDSTFVPSSLKESARRLLIVSHQTTAKNAGGEEWAKAVRELIGETHVTADGVFRAVIEDWESVAGYIGTSVDVDHELQGGGKTKEDLPSWKGIYAGLERMTGLLELLEEYISCKTSTPVTISLGVITDLISRMLSIPIPSSQGPKVYGGVRLHPAVDREERDALWTGMPRIYVAALKLTSSIAEVLGAGFVSLAQGSFDQLCWVFPSGKHSPSFRIIVYQVATKILENMGLSLDKLQVGKLSMIIRTCCQDLSCGPNFDSNDIAGQGEKNQVKVHLPNYNADTFLPKRSIALSISEPAETDISLAARMLLPVLLSRVPQQYLDISLRSLIERTAILASHKDAMLASILNPFIGKNGKALPTIMPHLTREFAHDDVVEILLRPRMPLLPSTSSRLLPNDASEEAAEDEVMDYDNEPGSVQEGIINDVLSIEQDTATSVASLQSSTSLAVSQSGVTPATQNPLISGGRQDSRPANTSAIATPLPTSTKEFLAHTAHLNVTKQPTPSARVEADVIMSQEEDDSDDESIHLNMELDTDSESGIEEEAL